MARYVNIDIEIVKLLERKKFCEQEAASYKAKGDNYNYRKYVSAVANAQMRINWLESMDIIEGDIVL